MPAFTWAACVVIFVALVARMGLLRESLHFAGFFVFEI